jgi:hypothetical protein
VLLHELERLAAVARLPYDLDLGLDVEERGECAEYHRLILGDDDPNHPVTGSVTVRRVPASA